MAVYNNSIVNREDFEKKLKEFYADRKGNRAIWNKKQEDVVKNYLIEAENWQLESTKYFYTKKYVTLNVPTVDRVPLDLPNILGVIMNKENAVYQIGTKDY